MTTPRFFLRAKFVGAITTAIVIMWSASVSAGILTLHFPDDLADQTCALFCNHNTTADGFRISPGAGYSTEVGCCGGFFIVPALSWSEDSPHNPDYLGPPPPFGIYIDHDGLPFDLLSIESIGISIFAESSKGGFAVIPDSPFVPGTGTPGTPSFVPPSLLPVHFDFVGPEWSNIQWVHFCAFGALFPIPPGGKGCAAVGAPFAGFDELVVFIPGPPTLGLFGLGILILGWRSLRDVKGRANRE